MTEGPRRKRGRPPHSHAPVTIEYVRDLTIEDLKVMAAYQWTRRGGRPKKDRDLNLTKELSKAAANAPGIPLRDFIRSWVKQKFGYIPDIREIRKWQRRIYRLREDKPVRQNPFL
jgi:hypothetical protein